MDRRSFIRGAGVTVAAAAAGVRLAPPAFATDDGVLPPLLWVPETIGPVISVLQDLNDVNTQRGFVTMLPVRDKLGAAAIDDWYVWLWTHDTSRTYLYTAPAAGGPYTARGYGEAPTPYPSNYLANHFSAGDIVWDPVGQRFISSPHGVRLPPVPGNAEVSQDSFLTESSDGLNWEWLDGNSAPRLVCGPPRSVDSVHTGYGRLLRDLDGHLATHAGRYWWIYRGQRNDGGNPIHAIDPLLNAFGTIYTPMLASSASLGGPFDQKRKAFDTHTLGLGLNSFHSFIRAGGTHHVYTSQTLPDPPIVPTKIFYNRTLGDDMTFLPTAVPFVFPPPIAASIIEGESNIIRDPATGTIYMAHTTATVSLAAGGLAVEVHIYRGIPI